VWALRAVLALTIAAVAGAASAADTLATYRLEAGWATFGLALPPSAAANAVQIGTLETQTDVKVRWPNGSIRFAVVSALVPRSGAYAIAAAQQSATTFVPILPQASVTLTIGGKPYVATLPPSLTDVWLNGPLVSERRAVVAPGAHPFLRVIFDVRSYKNGGHRVDVTVENCLDVPASDEVTYDVAVAVGGAKVFAQSAVTHKFLARWRRTFAVDGLKESAIKADLAPFVAARALPAFLPTVVNVKRALTGPGVSGAGFEILGFGDLTLPMDAHGGRPELAPYPDWTAQFLVHQTAAQRAYVVRHGELAGSWGMHIREQDGRVPHIDTYAYYWLDPRWRDNPGFQGPQNVRKDRDGNYAIPGRAQAADIAHQPSLAFVPYLMTGDRFFADEVAFWANFCLIGSFASDYNRKGAQGLLVGNEVRGIGWALRNLGDAAAYLPDASGDKSYFASKVWNNLTDLDRYGATFQSGPLQTVFPNRRPEDSEGRYQPYMWISLWEQTYVAWAIDRVMQHGQVTPAYNFANAGAALRDRIARLQLNLFVNPQWPRDRDRQVPYLLAAGKYTAPAGASGRSVAYFQTFGEMAAATFAAADPGHPPDFVRPFEGFYGPEARLLLMICEKLGERAATASLAALMADVNDNTTMAADLNRRSGWAIAPALAGATDARRAAPRKTVAAKRS